MSEVELTDFLRGVAIVLSLFVLTSLPLTELFRGRPPWVWLLLMSIDVLWIGRLIAAGHSFGEPLKWYGTPLTIAAALLAVGYVAASFSQSRNGKVKSKGESQ